MHIPTVLFTFTISTFHPLHTAQYNKKKLADHSHRLAQAEGMTPTERKPTLTL